MFVDRRVAGCVALWLVAWGGTAAAVEPAPEPLSVVLAGDVMLDNGPGHALAQGEDPFADFAALLGRADVSVCNLECVVAEGGRQQRKPYTFKARPECIAVLARHFSAVGVANNHSGDFGKKAFAQQLQRLEEGGLPYFGGGRDRPQARRPLILTRKGRRVALLGYDGFPPRSFEAGPTTPGVAWLEEEPCLAEIAAARSRDHADIVIPFLHWGREMQPHPEPWQRSLAQRMIDAGADAVIGTHAHVSQTVDVYHGKPIVYSLGNFVFDYYPSDPPLFTGWIVRFSFDPARGVELETHVLTIDRAGIPHPAEEKGHE